MKYTLCTECPCLGGNSDESWCNIGYETDLRWFNKKTGELVKDTPEMRSHQNDFELHYSSTDCKLKRVQKVDFVLEDITTQ